LRSGLLKDKSDNLTIEHFIIRKAYITTPFMVVKGENLFLIFFLERGIILA